MKKLTLVEDGRRVQNREEVIAFERQIGVTFPENLREFILAYEGSQVVESYFLSDDGVQHEIHQVLYLKKSDLGGANVEAIFQGHGTYGIKGFIPFAIDQGGWDYNVSINHDTYGQIWVNQFDSGDEDTLAFVCNSLEEFVDGLSENE